MDYYFIIMYLHLFTVIPAFFIGTAVLIMKKGTKIHRQLGRVYHVLMLFTGIITLFLPAFVGPKFLGHFGFIHIFSLLAIKAVPSSYLAAKRGDIKKHKREMIGLYIGGLIIAGGFTFFPGRYMHTLFFG